MVKEHRKQTERMIGMTRKFLEEMGLEKEQIDKILDENSQDIGKAKGDLEKVQNDLNTANTEIGTLKNTLKERDGQLETLKNSKDDVEGLKQQIQTLQNENKAKDDTHAAEIRQLKVDSAVNAALMAAHAKNTKAVVALLELENAELPSVTENEVGAEFNRLITTLAVPEHFTVGLIKGLARLHLQLKVFERKVEFEFDTPELEAFWNAIIAA